MKLTASAFFGMALVLSGIAAWAQDTTATDDAWRYFFYEEILQRSCDDPTLESAIALPQPKLILQASDDGKTKVKARVGVELTTRFVLSLDVTSPKSSSGETTLATLDGLSSGSTADLALSWYAPWNSEKYKEGIPAVKASKALKATEWHMEKYANPILSRPSGIAALGKDNYKEVLQGYREWMRDKRVWIPVFTLRGHAEQKGFDFFVPSAGPPAGLKKTSESHTNYQIIGSAGSYFWGTAYASLNYSRGTAFESGATKDFCAASSLTGVLNCETLVIAPPEKKQAEILEFEARGLAGPFGLGTHVTRDLRTNVTVVELPVYILQKLGTSEMEMNLGARLQWRSDTRKYALSVFIGPALSSVLRTGR
jgi:hypothetical protein